MVLPDSHRLPLIPWYLGTPMAACELRLRGYHPLWRRFPSGFGSFTGFLLPDRSCHRSIRSRNPPAATRQGLTRQGFRLFPVRSPLLGESWLLSLPRVTEMFQFARCPLPALYIQAGVTTLEVAGFPHSDSSGSQAVAPPRRLSQLTASFIGFLRQGIHRTPFLA